MIAFVRDRLLGFAEIRVRGEPIRFFRRAIGHGITLHRLRFRKEGLEAEVPLESLPILQGEATALGLELQVLRTGGLPLWLRRLRRRPAFLTAFLLFLFGYIVLGSLIWQVRVVGVGAQDAARLRRVAAELGLRPGVLRALVPAPDIARRLRQLPGIEWVGIRFFGVDAYIEAVPALPEPSPRQTGTSQDLVATRDGIVTRVVVFRGSALVRPGDTVLRGQILIRGEEGMSERAAAESGETPGPPIPVQAEGLVWARVFETVTTRLGRFATRWEPTGRQAFGLDLRWADRELSQLRYPARLGEVRWSLYRLRLPLVPLEVVWQQGEEVRRVVRRRSVAALKQEIAERLHGQMLKRLGTDARWLRRRESFKIEGNEVVGTLAVEAEMNIAAPGAAPVEERRPE